MKAVIIAAGKGTRMGSLGLYTAKSFLKLNRKTKIIDFILTQLREINVREVIIATRSEFVEQFKRELENQEKLNIRIVSVERRNSGNLYTLKSAVKQVRQDRNTEKILLVMSDHLFEREIVRRLLKTSERKGIVLCLDRKPLEEKMREGLKIKIRNGIIERVGKDVYPANGIDTGLFVLSKKVFPWIDELIEKRGAKAEIDDLVNYSAEKREVGFIDVTGCLWIDVDTPRDLIEARRMYWEILRRDLYKPWDGVVSRYLNRPLSTRASVWLYKKKWTVNPTLISVVSFLTGIISAMLFFFNCYALAGILTHFSSLLDGMDGELARLTGKTSLFGKFIDTVLDRAVDVSLMLSLCFSIYNMEILQPGFIMVLLALSTFGVVMVSYVSMLLRTSLGSEEFRKGFPWATRDVRLFSVTLGGVTATPLMPLLFCSFAPTLFLLKAAVMQWKGKQASFSFKEG